MEARYTPKRLKVRFLHPKSLSPFWPIYAGSQIRTILDILEQKHIERLPNIDSAEIANYQRIKNFRLKFSPLFFIETRLIELICPDTGVRDTCVRASTGWQDRLRSILQNSTPEYRRRSELDPSIVLAASKDTVNELWQQPNVKMFMDQYSKLHMGGVGTSWVTSSSLWIVANDLPSVRFLDDIDRVAALNYEPTDRK